MNHSDDELRQAVGLFRYGLIADLAHLPPGTPGIGERLREKANHAYTIPGTRRTRVAAETIRDWLALYRSGGFEALYPKARVDRGRPRRLPPDIAELLVGLKTEQPSLSVNALIAVARERGVERPLAPSTVHRLLSREGLLDKRPGEPVAIDRRRFAFRYAGELWMSDVMHGPKVSDGRRRRKTFLMAFIDDATRVLPFAAFDFSESTTAFLPVLKSALTRRGLPLRLYVDNGANYRSHQLLSVTLFRRGFLGLFLVDRGSICHIDPSSSESRAGAVRLEGQGGATVIAMITGVVVKMDWPAHPTPGSAGGG